MKKKSLINIILFFSLAFNFIFVGLIATHDKGGKPRGGNIRELEKKVDELKGPEKEEARKIMQEHKAVMRQNMEAIKQKKQEIDALLSGPDYTRENAEEKFKELRVLMADSLEDMHEMLINLADKLPPEERGSILPKKGPPL